MRKQKIYQKNKEYPKKYRKRSKRNESKRISLKTALQNTMISQRRNRTPMDSSVLIKLDSIKNPKLR